MAEALLEVEGLSVRYASNRGPLLAVDDASFSIPRGRALGLVGESGSGKSTILLALLGLLGSEATVTARKAEFLGQDLAEASPRLRGDRIGVVFQDAGAALNPALTVGLQIAEPLIVHRGLVRCRLDRNNRLSPPS